MGILNMLLPMLFILLGGKVPSANCNRKLYRVSSLGLDGQMSIVATQTYSIWENVPNSTYYDIEIQSDSIRDFWESNEREIEVRVAI